MIKYIMWILQLERLVGRFIRRIMYDIIVIGAGHAGCEAALISEKMGMKVLLVTGNLEMTGSMPCNPSIGGPAKGIVVREIDALGGMMGKLADMCQIQTKMLNRSKGPAVQALRDQVDKMLYPREMLKVLQSRKNLDLVEAYVDRLIIEDNKVCGVVLENGQAYDCKAVVITTGTYLRSKILRGHTTFESGPDDQRTTNGLSKQLVELGFDVLRLKTGTPARIKTDTINFAVTSEEPGDKEFTRFSFDKGYEPILDVSVPCHLTYTTKEIHEYIIDNLSESAMYGGVAEGIGPRYCPSIEDKIVRFNDKDRHQIFFEPESMELNQTYIQGYSTSMCVEVQDKMIHMLPGLENCEVIRYAYAIEYDAINPLNLWPSLETKLVENLFSAGQINGTSGYEEAAAQGLMAGANAALKISGKEPLILKRDEAYIGVMIDDLVTKGTKEPYRLLTSRAEYRLLLRHDNADLRLREYGYKINSISLEQYNYLIQKKNDIVKAKELFTTMMVRKTEENNKYLESIGSTALLESVKAITLIRRPEVSYKDILNVVENKELLLSEIKADLDEVLEQVEIEVKYEGYIKKALAQAAKAKSYEEMLIPDGIDYKKVDNLALEAREKLNKIQPKTIGQASRISGVNPADVAVLVVYIETLKEKK